MLAEFRPPGSDRVPMQRCLLPGIVAAALLAVAAHQARPMTGGGVRVHLVCAVAAPAPEALCAAMQEALATALPDARIRTAAPVEADPEAWTLRFTARQPGPHSLLGRLEWQRGAGPESAGPEIGFDVMDTALGPRFLSALLPGRCCGRAGFRPAAEGR
jgi:hypothetical protein